MNMLFDNDSATGNLEDAANWLNTDTATRAGRIPQAGDYAAIGANGTGSITCTTLQSDGFNLSGPGTITCQDATFQNGNADNLSFVCSASFGGVGCNLDTVSITAPIATLYGSGSNGYFLNCNATVPTMTLYDWNGLNLVLLGDLSLTNCNASMGIAITMTGDLTLDYDTVKNVFMNNVIDVFNNISGQTRTTFTNVPNAGTMRNYGQGINGSEILNTI
jgi:hypothetical protein